MYKRMGILFLCFILMLTVLFGCKINNNNENSMQDTNVENSSTQEETTEPEKKLNILDVNSKSRPYAIMINNNHAAWPHAGLQDAYLTYEIVVEGGITRMMALFKDKNTTKIGSIRSARHYFLDYALENDAIYVHFGQSPQAESDLKKLGVDNINGLYDSTTFWRDTTLKKATEHTVFTSMEKLKAAAQKKSYNSNTKSDLLLNYSVDEVDLSQKEGAKVANDITIKYSNYHTTSYTYDEENKVYKRSMSGQAHVDAITGKQYTVKNIIVYQVKNYALNDGSGKDRQGLNNVGNGEGYYITDGYAVPITWEKKSRSRSNYL